MEAQAAVRIAQAATPAAVAPAHQAAEAAVAQREVPTTPTATVAVPRQAQQTAVDADKTKKQ